MEPENQQDNFDLKIFEVGSCPFTSNVRSKVAVIRFRHWRGGGQSLEGRRTATGGALGRGQSLEGRRTATGGAEDSYWRGGGQ